MTDENSLEALNHLNRVFVEGKHVATSSDVDAVEWAVARIDQLTAENERLRAEVEVYRSTSKPISFTSYCWGYEKGHNDTVESSYTPPSEYPEDFQDIYDDVLADVSLESGASVENLLAPEVSSSE